MKFLLPLMLVLATCWASNPLFEDVPPQVINEVLDNYRLSTDDIKPTEYKIELTPIFESTKEKESFTFQGKSEIILDIKKPDSNSITFHAKELKFDDKEITLTFPKKAGKRNETEVLKPVKVVEESQKDFVTLIFDKKFGKENDVKLNLQYNGKLNDGLRGFFRDSYEDKDGKKVWLAATHFEPVYARQAFPCWDEPNIKTPFNIIINVPDSKKYKAISNMSGKLKDKTTTTTFDKTPPMPTYLVAFAVSDFTDKTNKEKTFSVWARPTAEETEKEFAFNFGLETLVALKDFTNIDYYGKEQAMKKMDQIALPGFNGAMENWGLVTYRESGLLYTKNKTTTEAKQSIATVIAHEFAHQWFGNLVTCEWWNDIWLNEGFATFFQYYITDKVIPKLHKGENWRLMEQFAIKNVQAQSFVVDASSKTHALSPPKNSIQTPTQIRSLFDDISYKKGASILNMMYGLLSEKIFQTGLQQYLITNYKNSKKGVVISEDLFDSMQESDKKKYEEYLPKEVKNFKDVMKDWVNKPGYPVINVKWSKTPGVVNITQERFFLIKPTKKDNTEWYIPLNYVTQESPNEVLPKDKRTSWMIPGQSKTFDKLNNTQWILFNKDQTGFYRVNYEDTNWDRLTKYLKSPSNTSISMINRAQLIDDALNLARTGHLKYEIALEVTTYLSGETDYIPWYAAVRGFNYLDSVLQGAKNYTNYHKYVAEKIKTFANKVNYKDWQNGTHVDKLAKVLALNTACKYDLKDCKEFASQKLKDWLENKINKTTEILWPDIRSGILCAGLRNEKNPQTWYQTLQKYNTTGDKDEKKDILAGLGCATSKEIVQKFLELTLEKKLDVDIFAAMNSVLNGNPESFDIIEQFINNNSEKIQNADKGDNSLLIPLLNNLANRVVTTNQYIELSVLVHGHLQVVQKVNGLTVAVQKLQWVKDYQKTVEEWIWKETQEDTQKKEPDSASSIALTSFLLVISLLITRFY